MTSRLASLQHRAAGFDAWNVHNCSRCLSDATATENPTKVEINVIVRIELNIHSTKQYICTIKWRYHPTIEMCGIWLPKMVVRLTTVLSLNTTYSNLIILLSWAGSTYSDSWVGSRQLTTGYLFGWCNDKLLAKFGIRQIAMFDGNVKRQFMVCYGSGRSVSACRLVGNV